MTKDPEFARVAVPVPLSPIDTLVDYRIPDSLRGQVQAGSLVTVPFGRQILWALVFHLTDEPLAPKEKIKEIQALRLPRPIFDRERMAFLTWLSKHYFYPIGEVCETAIPAGIREGSAKTLKLPEAREASAAPTDAPKNLNVDQAAAVRAISAPDCGLHLLWGVTGSGKTEVYLQAIARKLEAGKGALILVPEISLTPQLTERFESRFPGAVAIFHSGLKPTQLRRAWLETLCGQRRIAVGARSALFAPLLNPGIVIVDEEHDGSYKQDDRLRYNARDGAAALAEMYRIPCVIGSATPSSESLYAVDQKQAGVSMLPRRATESAVLPEILLVDLRKGIAAENKTPIIEVSEETELPSVKGDFFLSTILRDALTETLAQKKQAILFLNRRGLGSQELCPSCGHIPSCPNCEVNLSPHGQGLLCHYCAYELRSPQACAECGQSERPFLRVGVGTEAIESAIKFHYPAARLLRLDRDTTQSAEEYETTLRAFHRHEADILIGTQMVAKGHDFPDVTLVGILLAELGLALPDYRANERCLQLLLQVSGRAGRGAHPGRVLLQSFQPEHPVFQALAHQRSLEDYGAFLRDELRKRQELGYPPFGRLVLLRFDGLEEKGVIDAAQSVGHALKRVRAGIQVLGPVVSPLRKIRNRYRWQLLVKSTDLEACRKSVSWILKGWAEQKLEKKFRVRLTVDMDPVNML